MSVVIATKENSDTCIFYSHMFLNEKAWLGTVVRSRSNVRMSPENRLFEIFPHVLGFFSYCPLRNRLLVLSCWRSKCHADSDCCSHLHTDFERKVHSTKKDEWFLHPRFSTIDWLQWGSGSGCIGICLSHRSLAFRRVMVLGKICTEQFIRHSSLCCLHKHGGWSATTS